MVVNAYSLLSLRHSLRAYWFHLAGLIPADLWSVAGVARISALSPAATSRAIRLLRVPVIHVQALDIVFSASLGLRHVVEDADNILFGVAGIDWDIGGVRGESIFGACSVIWMSGRGARWAIRSGRRSSESESRRVLARPVERVTSVCSWMATTLPQRVLESGPTQELYVVSSSDILQSDDEYISCEVTSGQLWTALRRTAMTGTTYHSPVPPALPGPLGSLIDWPAAAEAKLEVNVVGILNVGDGTGG